MADEPDLSTVPEPEPSQTAADAGLTSTAPVLIPVTAEDVARRKRRIVALCVLAALIVGGSAAWIYKRSTDPLKAQESYDAGKRLMTLARYPQAILSFDRAILLKPDFGEAYLMRARARVSLYDAQASIPDFSRGIALRPRDPLAYIDRGRAYLLVKKYPEAIADATSAIQIEGSLAAAFNLRASATRDSGDPVKALQDFNRAVELTPNADNYYQRGATHQLLGHHREAISDFSQTIAFAPDQAHAYFARSESELAIGDSKAAQEDHLRGRILDGR